MKKNKRVLLLLIILLLFTTAWAIGDEAPVRPSKIHTRPIRSQAFPTSTFVLEKEAEDLNFQNDPQIFRFSPDEGTIRLKPTVKIELTAEPYPYPVSIETAYP
jgi:hypothetical protein